MLKDGEWFLGDEGSVVKVLVDLLVVDLSEGKWV
jgi:hypothetical protein